MSSRFIIIALKTVTFAILSTIMVATVYGYRLDDSGVLARTGIVDITFVPRDAQLFVDGARIETAGGKIVLPLAIGNHEVSVRKLGFQPVRKTIQVDGTMANRMGTVYLSPLQSELDWSGYSDAAAVQVASTGPVCETETTASVQGGHAVKNGRTVTMGGQVVSREAAAMLATRKALLVGSEFSLMAVDPSTLSTTTLHRFDARITTLATGPSEDNVFVSTTNDVALCSIPNAVCTHVMHSPERINNLTYDTGSHRLTVSAGNNQRMDVVFDAWGTSFFGF